MVYLEKQILLPGINHPKRTLQSALLQQRFQHLQIRRSLQILQPLIHLLTTSVLPPLLTYHQPSYLLRYQVQAHLLYLVHRPMVHHPSRFLTDQEHHRIHLRHRHHRIHQTHHHSRHHQFRQNLQILFHNHYSLLLLHHLILPY